jgi:hypothetical protein
MHEIKSFATALVMASVFSAMFWAQVGMMATGAAAVAPNAVIHGVASNPYQDAYLTHGPSLGEFASLAR